jgi:antitoxin component YwqK of YwqJK toxin-antitoxin module
MKKIIVNLLLITLVVSCNSNNDITTIELGENKEVDMSALCNCDSLATNSTGILTLKTEVFSGKCFSNYPNSDQKYIEKEILKGEYHGKVTYFDKQGELLYSETYNKGASLGDVENQPNCNCMDIDRRDENGVKKHYLNKSLYTGKCSDNFPNSDQVYLEANYKDGLLHGYTIYYQKDGKVLIIHNYENGEIIKEITPQR